MRLDDISDDQLKILFVGGNRRFKEIMLHYDLNDYSTKYLPMLSVIMNEGGASNGTINGRITLNKEIFKSFKENDLKVCF